MVKADGGSLIGDPGTHFLYPGVQGFDVSGGLAGPDYDFNKDTSGDMKVAEKYMKLAGYPSGKYTGSQTVSVVGSTGNPAAETAQIVNQTLQNLGFKTNFNLVDQSVMYAKYCGVPKSETDVCPNVGWIRDFADPQTIIDPTFAGKNIVPTNNSNFGQVTVADKQINAAEDVVGAAARAKAWAKVDDLLVDQAVAVPWIFDKQPQIESKNVAGVSQIWNEGAWDYDFTSLR
jgi:peptide/nickel transport system substrate-binding protein